MSNGFTLDQLREAADAKFGDFTVELSETSVVRLQSPVRLPQATRVKIREYQDFINQFDEAEEQDPEQLLQSIYGLVREVARDKRPVNQLIKELDGDIGAWMVLLEAYGKDSQVGEA